MSQPGITVHDIFTQEIRDGLADGSILLVDVREPHEYAAGHIPGAVLMPLSEFDPHKLPNAHGKRIIFSCRTGGRTLTALKLTQEAGIPLTEHYKPSFNGWVSEGGEVAYGE